MKFFHRKPGIKISVIAIFHNMRREAPRTLYSLSAHYQEGILEDDYEVLAIDSNSSSPLDSDMVMSYGSQFRYYRVTSTTPSPAKALNFGVEKAGHSIVMLCIDGARILSPGILSKTLRAFREIRNPFVYTIGMHLGDKVQNESILEGYSQTVEDRLIDSIDWRANGYDLFKISCLARSCKDGFFSRISESNCVSVYKSRYLSIGGFDERFASRGGGIVNLDFFNKLMMDNAITPVCLLGESTFHQFHGGVATNVPFNEHPWTEFSEECRAINGKDYRMEWREHVYLGRPLSMEK